MEHILLLLEGFAATTFERVLKQFEEFFVAQRKTAPMLDSEQEPSFWAGFSITHALYKSIAALIERLPSYRQIEEIADQLPDRAIPNPIELRSTPEWSKFKARFEDFASLVQTGQEGEDPTIVASLDGVKKGIEWIDTFKPKASEISHFADLLPVRGPLNEKRVQAVKEALKVGLVRCKEDGFRYFRAPEGPYLGKEAEDIFLGTLFFDEFLDAEAIVEDVFGKPEKPVVG